MIALKKHNNDDLIKYLLNVLEMLKSSMMEEKDFRKLLILFNPEKIIKLDEEKVIETLRIK